MIITKDKFAYLQAVAEEGNITRAAEKLYVSQPALTNYINKVESYYGIRLFNRVRNPVTLTYAGEQFMKGMGEIIQLQKKFDHEMEELANHRADRITIGMGSTRASTWLPYLLPSYKNKYPEIDVEIIEDNNANLEQRLLKGTIDFVVTSLPLSTAGIDYEMIGEEKIYLIIPQGHPILNGKDLAGNSIHDPLSVTPEELNGQHFLISKEGQNLNTFAKNIFEECKITPGEMTEVAGSMTAYLLACYGNGLALITDSVFATMIPMKKPVIANINNKSMSREVVAAYNSSVGLSVFTKAFIEITKETADSKLKQQIASYWK